MSQQTNEFRASYLGEKARAERAEGLVDALREALQLVISRAGWGEQLTGEEYDRVRLVATEAKR